MTLNRDTFDRIIDAAIKAEDLVIQTPTGEAIGEHHAGLHHGNDFKVWLPEYAPHPRTDNDNGEADDGKEKDNSNGGKGTDNGGGSPGPEPAFRTWGESAKMAVDKLKNHMATRTLDWTSVEEVTLQSAQLSFLSYLASLAQGAVNARFSYECHSDDNNITLVVRKRSAEQWMRESRTVERINEIAGVMAGDARAVIKTEDNSHESIRGRLEALDNSHDIQLTATFKNTKEDNEI